MRDTRVDEVCAIQEFGFRHWGDEGEPAHREGFKEWLRTKRYDAVLDPSHAASGAGKAIWENGGLLLDACDSYPDPIIEQGGSGIQSIKAAFLRGWGLYVPEDWAPGIHIGLRDHLWARTFLRFHLPGERMVIALSPAGSASPKIWPHDRLVQLGNRLLARGYRLLLLGGAELNDMRFSALRSSDRVLTAQDRHLLRVAALLDECDGLVCNDTGVMHIGAAVGTPLVALFGPTDPSIYLPRRQDALAVVGDRQDCAFRERTGIGPSRCQIEGRCLNGDESCICAIGVEEVFCALEEVLRGGADEHKRDPSAAKPRPGSGGAEPPLLQDGE
jgi:ADP-heptose:LPS heptosyltransferase